MTNKEKELLQIFCGLSDKTQDSILSHVRFSAIAENAVKKQIAKQHPDLKIDFGPVDTAELRLAVNHG